MLSLGAECVGRRPGHIYRSPGGTGGGFCPIPRARRALALALVDRLSANMQPKIRQSPAFVESDVQDLHVPESRTSAGAILERFVEAFDAIAKEQITDPD